MSSVMSGAVKRLHQLAWQPGAWVDRSWWAHLSLAEWESIYDHHASCRRAIDATLVARRGFPKQPLPGTLSVRQNALMALEPRLSELATALGLIALDCPEYLLLRDYREALSIHLGNRACEQLFILHPGWKARPTIEDHSRLGEVALQTGTQWLSREAGNCAVSHGLLGLLPHSGNAVHDSLLNQTASAPEWLIKLGRFL